MKLVSFIFLLVIPTICAAQNTITGSIQYDQKPVQRFAGNAYVYEQQQKVIGRINAAYSINGIKITSSATVNLSDINDISALINFTIPIP